ncbi:WD repeat-containing protein 75 [Microplitis demolitor]|uniref:WD repeat-containing protein 75 n=1 Tax=Microplitis demolitor TaxID=69319 RepID=UPI0004CCA1C2|nr:WD repeat-containing protein 75 [Microplitis demolitor]
MKEKMTRKSSNHNDSRIDDLVVKRKGGGSIIDHRPLFSNDGEILYVVWKQIIRAYSTQTGDFVRELEPAESKITGIASTENNNTIIGCTENGVLINWDSHGLITKNLKLKTHKNIKIKSFNIVNYINVKGNATQQALITYYVKPTNTIYLVLFDLENGNDIKSTSIRATSEDYSIDIIGNYGNNLIALAQDLDLHILQPSRNLSGKLHKIGFGGRKFTCVAGHPEEDCVATGDSSGRVAVWRNLFANRATNGSYHWHTLPVTEVVFSRTGGHMYSGGSECVLVKWTLSNPHQKNFLPRLPAPIKHLTIAPNNLYVAVSTLDNGIIVVNPQRKLTAVIQNFTWGVGVSQKDLFPAGLTLDPRTGSLVLNSRTGHVQFFDTQTKSLLYNVNITAQNFLTQERSVVIVNTEVTKIALNYDGSWMATIEERDDKISCPEVRLKFWKFDTEKQVFALNTSIELPHEYGVNALKFQSRKSLDEEDVLAVTTGEDDKFKLWNLSQPSSIYQKSRHWQCYGVGTYRGLPVSDAGFSQDGSLLGVGFGSSLTIWTPDSNNLKCSLTNSRYPQEIKRIEFGKFEACHLVIAASCEHIAVWNLLTLSIIWSVPLKIKTLTADSQSAFMATFTEDNTLYVFTPLNSTPVYTRKNILEYDNSVLAASFVPHPCEKRLPSYQKWQRKSQLFFLDSNQELLTLESESEASISLENLIGNGLPATAFSSMIAEQTTSNVERESSFFHDQFNTSKKSIAEELLSISPHTLPSKKILYGPFVLSFKAHIAQKVKVQEEKPSGEDIETVNDESTAEESDDENKSISKSEDSSTKDIKLTNQHNIKNDTNDNDDEEFENNPNLVSYDWTCVADIYSNETL